MATKLEETNGASVQTFAEIAAKHDVYGWEMVPTVRVAKSAYKAGMDVIVHTKSTGKVESVTLGKVADEDRQNGVDWVRALVASKTVLIPGNTRK